MIVNDVFIDRMIFTAIGAVVGLLLGLLLSFIREAKEAKQECHELRNLVERWMENESHDKREHGTVSFNTVALAIVVLLTAFAAFQSQAAVNKVDNAQDCTTSVVFGALISLNERTTFTVDQANANIKLQKAQADFLTVSADEESTEQERRTAFQGYFDALIAYNELAAKTAAKVQSYPFPDPQDYKDCLEDK